MVTNMERLNMAEWVKNLRDLKPQAANCNTTARSASEDRTTVRQALRLRREIEAFEAQWPTPRAQAAPVPTFSWEQLERQLADLTDNPAKAAMARDLVSATRKMSGFKPPEMVLREILCMTWALLDESFQPGLDGEKGTVDMT
jgi:hypothetical protein